MGAERETCEETGYQVKAIRKLAHQVFFCKIVKENVCTKPVDEGFLEKQWYGRSKAGSLSYRGGTWGDKRGLILRHLKWNNGRRGCPRCLCMSLLMVLS